ncbi:MAG: hypothetical protein EHM68_17215 [Lysobacterales bacterium]|nr:MAG: hypothetical protein EHM68_17215 [Xanthomonadales bacterium]
MLSSVPLVTSIPPQISRQATDGTEIGREYALACIRSWRTSGFHPVTVNAEGEGVPEWASSEEIGRLTVKRNAREQFGRPLVYLHDLIAAARSLTEGPVVVVNSDILLEMNSAMQQRISNIRPGECLISRRTDIHDLDCRVGQEYARGFDFFACHSHDLAEYANHDFVFGMPWWDHYFPIHLFLGGLKSLPAAQPFAFHLAHEEAWERSSWFMLGNRFLDAVRSETLKNGENAPLAIDYARRRERALLGSDASLTTRTAIRLRNLTEGGRTRNGIDAFHRMSALNMAWLDEVKSRVG